MAQLTTPSRSQAHRLMRTFESTARLQAGIMTPMAGSRPLKLSSLKELEAFLVCHDPGTLLVQAPLARVHYVDPVTLVRWVRDVLQDEELAGGLHEIVASRRPYGFLVPEIKELLAERIAQCDTVIGETSAAAG